jgi:hypothetical protein
MLFDTFTSRTSEMKFDAVTCLLNLPGEWHYQIATAEQCAGAAYTNNGVPTCQRGTPIGLASVLGESRNCGNVQARPNSS